MKIAIIGSGIAGLTAGYRLGSEHDVTLFERLDRPGMDAHRSRIEIGGETVFADVPSRMFNSAEWPELLALYEEIGVATEPVDSTQSFSTLDENGAVETFLKFAVAYRPQIGVKEILSSRVRTIIADARRLMQEGRADLESGRAGDNRAGNSIPFGRYLAEAKYSREFIYEFLFPTLSSTVCTCSYDSLNEYPAEVILACLRNLNSDRELLRTTHGTEDVVDRLVPHIPTLRTGVVVKSVRRERGGVIVATGDETEFFDQLVFATQANTALSILSDASELESATLSAIRYGNIEIALHTDNSLMPAQEKDWSTFNMISNRDSSAAMCSVWLNRFHRQWQIGVNVFQTINPVCAVRSEAAIASVRLQRPVVTQSTAAALQGLTTIHDQEKCCVWFCGSWAEHGVPLLETGVRSANTIAKRITARASRSVG